MSIIVNGVEIPANGDFINYNGTNVEKVIANGVVVWEKFVKPTSDKVVYDAYTGYIAPGTIFNNFTLGPPEIIFDNSPSEVQNMPKIVSANHTKAYCSVDVDVSGGYQSIYFSVKGDVTLASINTYIDLDYKEIGGKKRWITFTHGINDLGVPMGIYIQNANVLIPDGYRSGIQRVEFQLELGDANGIDLNNVYFYIDGITLKAPK